MNRKQRRSAEKQMKKDGTEEVAEKVALFGKLEDECLVCEEPFDKKNKEMVMSWNVVVREKEGKVNLYCPTCWERAQSVIEQARKMVEANNDGEE
jgi:ribosomal protein L44E|tara:strand:+ start:270 stop:554 length:285 start_codon:yes stop_codon:yes gene_type:complete